MSKKKKIIILTSMVALLAATAICNFLFSQDTLLNNGDKSVQTATYFSEHRSERTTTRSEQLIQLDSIIASAEESSQAKEQALQSKLRLTEIAEQELLLESLVKAKGFTDVVVLIGLDSDYVSVIVDDDDLTTDDAVVIYTILQEQLNCSPEKVRIWPVAWFLTTNILIINCIFFIKNVK